MAIKTNKKLTSLTFPAWPQLYSEILNVTNCTFHASFQKKSPFFHKREYLTRPVYSQSHLWHFMESIIPPLSRSPDIYHEASFST